MSKFKTVKAFAVFYKNKLCRNHMGDFDLVTNKKRFLEGHYPEPWSIREIEIRPITQKPKRRGK